MMLKVSKIAVVRIMLLLIAAVLVFIIITAFLLQLNVVTNFKNSFVLISLFGAIITLGTIFWSFGVISSQFNLISGQLQLLSAGRQSDNRVCKIDKSLKQIARSINQVSISYKNIAQYINNLQSDNFSQSFILRHDNDIVGQSLINIKASLVEKKHIIETRAADEQKLGYINSGLAMFNDIVRNNNNNREELYYKILTQIIEYTNSVQGAIFINFNDTGNAVFKNVATVAYDRRRLLKQEYMIGEGLVGRCAFEKLPVYLTDIPESYIQINSGMGGATPRSLLLMPLKVEQTVYGVIELASFNTMDDYKIEFVEKLANQLASQIASIQLTNKTEDLLKQARLQSDELKLQREQLEQNMEELKSVQDEMVRKQNELIENKNLLNTIIDLVPFPVFVKNNTRQYIIINQEQAKLYNMPANKMLNKTDDDFITDEQELDAIRKSDNYVLVRNQRVKLPEQELTVPDGSKKILQTIKVPFKNNLTGNVNILGVSVDLSDLRKAEQELEAVSATVEKLRTELEENTVMLSGGL